MKMALKLLAAVLLTLATVAFGYWLGLQSTFAQRMWKDTALTRCSTEAAIQSMQVSQINSGKIDSLKSLLNIQLDGNILTLGMLIDWDHPTDNDRAAIKILARIADRRASEGYSNTNVAAQAQVDDYLRQSQAFTTKKE